MPSTTSTAGRAVLSHGTTTRRGGGSGRAGGEQSQAVVITTSQLGRMKQLASQPTAAMHQAGRVLGGHSAKFETSGTSSLPRSLDASVKSVKHTIGRRQTKLPAAQARKEHMQTLDRQRHARLAAEASRLEAERGFLETDEEMRLKVEEKSRPALKYARQRRQEDLDEIKDLNVRMNGARVLKEQEEQIARKRAMAQQEAAAEAAWYNTLVQSDLVKVREETLAAREAAARSKAEYRAALQQQLEERDFKRQLEAE
ncbi:unnamed protein product, partial [Symbiodinium sp. KB8]